MPRPLTTLRAVAWSAALSIAALAGIHALNFAEGETTAQRRFTALAERYLDESLRCFPTQASIHGYHRYDGLLEDFSPESRQKMATTFKVFQKELLSVDRARLPVADQVDRDLLLQDCEATLFMLAELRPFASDPLFYNQILGSAALFITQVDPDSPEFTPRLRSLLERMKKIPALLEQARRNLDRPPEVSTRFCLTLNPGNIEFFEKTLPPLAARAPELREAVTQESARVAAALRGYQKWLETDLLPRSHGDWRLGRERWEKKLRQTLASDLTAEEIVKRAEVKLQRDREEMLQVARPLHDRYFPDHQHAETGDDLINAVVRETLERLGESHSRPEALVSDVRQRWIPKIKDFIRKSGLVELPPEDDNFVVEPTPAFLDGIATAFFNPAPAFEPGLKKSFWVSSIPRGATAEEDARLAESYLREYNDYGLQSLIIHEAYPGHYVQSYHALRSPLATITKKVYASGTFAEGWAVLAEEEMFTNGFAEGDPANYLGHKKFGLRVSLNALLDSKLHTGGMAEAEADRWALDLMTRLGFQEEAEAKAKLRRAKITSTQLSTYFVGFTELSDLMRDVKAREGEAFRLRDFNQRLLGFGTIPPRDVRRLMFTAAVPGPPPAAAPPKP